MTDVTLTMIDLIRHLAVAAAFMTLACGIVYWGRNRKP